MESTGNSCWLNISAASKGVIYHWRQSKFTGGGGGRLRDGPKALSEARTQPRSAERDGSGRVRHMGVRGYYLHIFSILRTNLYILFFVLSGAKRYPRYFYWRPNLLAVFTARYCGRARRCHSMSSVCPSMTFKAPWSHKLEYFENNFTAD